MRELLQEPLKKHTSLRIGGVAPRIIIPESKDELIESVREARAKKQPYFMLGRGSNVLAGDGDIAKLIIKNTDSCRELTIRDGVIEAGASIELQRLIRFCAENDLGGLEYLQSVPGNVGGAIYMNAGRGREYNKAISDFLLSVDVFDGERVLTLKKEDCRFGYRDSIFRQKDWVILGGKFAPPAQPKEKGLELIAERMRYVREMQDNNLPNAGTVFAHRFRLYEELKGERVNDAQFSTKTPNWILNLGKATCDDVCLLIRKAQVKHLLRGRLPPRLEWIFLR